MRQQYDKMNNAGYVVRGTPWRTDVEEVLEDVGEESVYSPAFR